MGQLLLKIEEYEMFLGPSQLTLSLVFVMVIVLYGAADQKEKLRMRIVGIGEIIEVMRQIRQVQRIGFDRRERLTEARRAIAIAAGAVYCSWAKLLTGTIQWPSVSNK